MGAADSAGDTPLHFSSKCGFSNIVTLLLDRGSDASTVDSDGKTAKDLAVNKAVAALFV